MSDTWYVPSTTPSPLQITQPFEEGTVIILVLSFKKKRLQEFQ